MIHDTIQRYDTFFKEINTYHNSSLILECILRYIYTINDTIRDITNNTYIFNFFLSIYFFKSNYLLIFFVKRIYHVNCLKYTKRLKIDHKKEK